MIIGTYLRLEPRVPGEGKWYGVGVQGARGKRWLEIRSPEDEVPILTIQGDDAEIRELRNLIDDYLGDETSTLRRGLRDAHRAIQLALTAIDEHLLGADINWDDVRGVLKRVVGEGSDN